GPSTRAASPRLIYPSSSLDSSSEKSLDSSSPSARPSHKRCRSPTTLVPSSTLVPGSIALALADLSPHKRFRNSYSSEASGEKYMEIGMRVEVATSDIREDEEDFEAEASARGTMEIVVDPLATGGIFESTGGDAPDLEGTLYDIAHYMSEVPLDKITEFETTQRQLEADRVDSLRRHMALSQEEFCQIRWDRDETRRRLRRLESLVERRLGFLQALETHEANRNIGLGNGNDEGGNENGNGNRNGGGNENRNHNENDRDARPGVLTRTS
nr:hypothetical protein [Tanacetum cinerariifolium]